MTDNLPAHTADEPTGPGGVPLSQTPTAALTFALGYIAASPVHADQYGGVCALVEELQSRFIARPASSIPTTEWAALLNQLPEQLARGLDMLYLAHKGQRWARTGRRA